MNTQEILIDHLYQRSSLQYFMTLTKVDTPHFLAMEPENKEAYISMDHFTINAEMPIGIYSTLENYFDLDVNKEFIDALLNEGRKELNRQFINFLEEHVSDVEELPLHPKKEGIARIMDFLFKNMRFTLKGKNKDEVALGDYFIGLLRTMYKEFPRTRFDEHSFIVVSEKIAQHIAFNVKTFEKGNYANTFLIHPFGSIDGHQLTVFVEPFLDENILYYGRSKTQGYGPICFYNVPENSLTEHVTNPMNYDIKRVYRLNMYHKIHAVGEVKYKKIIFEE